MAKHLDVGKARNGRKNRQNIKGLLLEGKGSFAIVIVIAIAVCEKGLKWCCFYTASFYRLV
ncbi:hypothetical protein [Marinomonas shanghaiensis]|uniref:hypothetical protein n=1 Tax=Marinomonas shanghaiensis TaxID=2202418 RepID=UPI003A95715A